MKPYRRNRYVISNFKRFIFVLLLLVASLPNPAFTSNESPLSQRDKEQLFDKVWDLINTRYYDPNLNGVNWAALRELNRPLLISTENDLEFYDGIKRMVGQMNDAHTRFLTPREARERRTRQETTVGLLLARVEGKTVVQLVMPHARGDLAKVKPGMIVRTVDGLPIESRFEAVKNDVGGSSSDRSLEILAYRRIMRGEPGTTVRVGVTDLRGQPLQLVLPRLVVSETSEVVGKLLSSGNGYISVSSFKAPISDRFKRVLLELKDARSLIIDLRYNGGGSINEVLLMAGFFLDRKHGLGKFMKRDGGSRQSLRKFSAGKKGGQIYSGPVVILTSKFSASGSELFSSSLQELGRAKIIGERTCGCLLGISRKHRLKDGSELHISDIGFISSKGKVYEKVGVTPDRFIEPRITDLQSGFDRGLSEAETMLNDAAADN